MTERLAINPCPFCGSSDVSLRDAPMGAYVECRSCEARGPKIGGDGKAEAVRVWNSETGGAI